MNDETRENCEENGDGWEGYNEQRTLALSHGFFFERRYWEQTTKADNRELFLPSGKVSSSPIAGVLSF